MFSAASLALREFNAPTSFSVIVTLSRVVVTAKAGGALVNAPVARVAAAAATTAPAPPTARRGWLAMRSRNVAGCGSGIAVSAICRRIAAKTDSCSSVKCCWFIE
jgi:hypothetical protein